MAKKARVWTGTEFVELASAQTDLTAYSTTAQVNTAITAGVGLVPILTQTIGAAVSSVTLSNVFSATYDNYRVILTGGVASVSGNIFYSLNGITTGYYSAYTYLVFGGTTGTSQRSNQANAFFGFANTSNFNGAMDLFSPNLAKSKASHFNRIDMSSGGSTEVGGSFNASTTQATDLVITVQTGTITGGTIYVYGYKK